MSTSHTSHPTIGPDRRRRQSSLSCAVLLVALAGLSPVHALTQEELVARIQAAGYAQVSDIKSTAEGITAKAMKNGKEVRLVVDSSGQVKERN
ncbi:PepSY domain-containing protein [Bradyrhizobium sp. BR 10289]|uniref:PepSY domain-containing protein n=1 Tax=Bradyrhizobium sp. BR 10289 TaxID=2749993 RepID=UPI0032E036E4